MMGQSPWKAFALMEIGTFYALTSPLPCYKTDIYNRNFFVGLWEGQYGEIDIAVLKESRNLLSPILDAIDKCICHLQNIKKGYL